MINSPAKLTSLEEDNQELRSRLSSLEDESWVLQDIIHGRRASLEDENRELRMKCKRLEACAQAVEAEAPAAASDGPALRRSPPPPLPAADAPPQVE